MTTPEILRRAADYVRGGWMQDRLCDAHGNVCANGAIISAVRGRRVTIDDFGQPSTTELIAYHQASTALRHVLQTESLWDVPKWNNAPDQTAENVAATMELAAICFEQAQEQPESLAAVDPKVEVLESGTRA